MKTRPISARRWCCRRGSRRSALGSKASCRLSLFQSRRPQRNDARPRLRPRVHGAHGAGCADAPAPARHGRHRTRPRAAGGIARAWRRGAQPARQSAGARHGAVLPSPGRRCVRPRRSPISHARAGGVC